MAVVADLRRCEQCRALFEPRREHARFCSARCRVAWNREHAGSRRVEATALDWSLTAMDEVTGRLGSVRAADRQQAFAVISEAVWWVTIVDGTLVRYHHEVYDAAMANHAPAGRRLIEGTLAGLRFVRNRMGYYTDHADFMELRKSPSGAKRARITVWRWRSLPEPDLGSLPPRGQAWEMTRYQAYQAQLADRTIGETFGQASAFLKLVSVQAGSDADVSTQAAPGHLLRRAR
jgi:hypothetical protein